MERQQLQQLLQTCGPLLNKVKTILPDNVEVLALAGMLHSFYTGIENIFKRIAVHVDGGTPRGNAWHMLLLNEISRPTDKRPAVISKELCLCLREYMDFRHVFRHAYTFQLEWRKMSLLVQRCPDVFAKLESELDAFIAAADAGDM